MLGVKPLKVVEVCQSPPSLLYSQPVMEFSVMLVSVFDAKVGASGAIWVALAMVAVGFEVTLPSQLAAATVTVMSLLFVKVNLTTFTERF